MLLLLVLVLLLLLLGLVPLPELEELLCPSQRLVQRDLHLCVEGEVSRFAVNEVDCTH